MEKIEITEVTLKRYQILSDVLKGELTLKEASNVLNLSYRQAIRLKKGLKQQGIKGLLKKARPKPPNLKITSEIKQAVISLKREIYSEFNLLHFRDKLIEVHNINISYESLRQILIKEGLHEAKKKRKSHRRRWRMPKVGMLVQMDSSQHAWLEGILDEWWLVAMKDDADGYVYGRLYPKGKKANKDNTIKFKGQTYQLLPTNGLKRFASKWVYVCRDQKAQITVLCDGNKIAYNLFQEKRKILNNSSPVEETMRTTDKVEKKKKWKQAKN